MQQCIKILLFPILNEARHVSGDTALHHQEPKIEQAASGFAYVEGCRACSCWTLSGSVSFIRSLKLYKQPLVLHTLKVVGRAVIGRCQVEYT
jgi:hypothetical protein